MNPPTDPKPGRQSGEAARRERLAAELRANLARRKAQARARATQERAHSDDEATPLAE